MIEGVEILSKTIIYVKDYPSWLIAVFACIGLIIGLIICIVDWCQYGFDLGTLGVAVMLVILCTMFGVLTAGAFSYDTDTVDYIEYKVTVDDSVSMNDFLAKYEIIDQEGCIYIVKGRATDGN